MPNPFDGILPDFAIFGAEFTQLWQKVLAGVWGIALVIAAIMLILAVVKLLGSGDNPNQRAEALKGLLWAGIATGVLLAIAVIWVAVASLVS